VAVPGPYADGGAERAEGEREERQVSRIYGGDAGDALFYEECGAAECGARGVQAAGVKCFDNHPNMKYVTVSDIAGHTLYWEFYLRKYWQYTSKTCTFISNMLKRG